MDDPARIVLICLKHTAHANAQAKGFAETIGKLGTWQRWSCLVRWCITQPLILSQTPVGALDVRMNQKYKYIVEISDVLMYVPFSIARKTPRQ